MDKKLTRLEAFMKVHLPPPGAQTAPFADSQNSELSGEAVPKGNADADIGAPDHKASTPEGSSPYLVPVLILCAVGKDKNRKGCTTSDGDEGGTGLWDYCEKLWADATQRQIPLNKSQSFYVGNAAGRFRDHSDCDRYLVRAMLSLSIKSRFFCCFLLRL